MVCQGPSPETITYLHAVLASNGHKHHIPFKAIANQTSSFISPEYLPAWFRFTDPRNMHKSTMEDFFNHVSQWQMAQGPERAFRFKRIKVYDGTVAPIHYPSDLNPPPPSQCKPNHRGRRNADAMTDADSETGTSNHPTAESNANAQAQAKLRQSKRKCKGK